MTFKRGWSKETDLMKIYLMTDMEGISGIHWIHQVKKEYPQDYAYGQRCLIREINFAVDALFSAGADEVVVCDGHTAGGNILMADMDGRARYEPWYMPSLHSLDASFDGVVLLGCHAKAGTLNGFLDHTMNSMEWFRYTVHGKEIGEIGLLALRAGAHGVPVLTVTGDEKAAEEAKELLGAEHVTCASVKTGIGRNWAECLPIPQAQQQIRRAIEEGIALIGKVKPYQLPLPAPVELTFYRSDFADRYNGKSDWDRKDARTVAKTISSFRERMW